MDFCAELCTEFCDVYDWQREKTGEMKERDGLFRDGEFFLIVHCCIFNGKGELLIQQRSAIKSKWTGLWDVSVGGAASAGESSSSAISRELAEELGLAVDFTYIRPHLTVNSSHCYDDVYILNMELEPERLQLQAEEVQAVRWANLAEIHRLIDCGEFIPYRKSFIALLFDLRNASSMLEE